MNLCLCQRFDQVGNKGVPVDAVDVPDGVTAAAESVITVIFGDGAGLETIEMCIRDRYNGSYSRSWEVLQNNLEKYPGIQVTIDAVSYTHLDVYKRQR